MSCCGMISLTLRFIILNLLLLLKVNAFENQELSLDSYNDLRQQDWQDITNQTREAGILFHPYTKIDSDISIKCDLR